MKTKTTPLYLKSLAACHFDTDRNVIPEEFVAHTICNIEQRFRSLADELLDAMGPAADYDDVSNEIDKILMEEIGPSNCQLRRWKNEL